MTELPTFAQFDSVAAEAMRLAASLGGPDDAVDTRTALLALAYVHVLGKWDLIWLRSRYPDEIERQKGLRDPVDEPREAWHEIELTATCANSLRAAARIARRYGGPIAPGALFLGLLADPTTAAARALGVGTAIEHDDLMNLAATELLNLSNLWDAEKNAAGAEDAAITAVAEDLVAAGSESLSSSHEEGSPATTSTPGAPQVIRTLEGPGGTIIFDMEFSPSGQLLACGSTTTLHLWDPATGTHQRTLRGAGGFMSVAFSPDERLLAGGGPDGTVRLWDLPAGEQVRTLDGNFPKLPGVTFIMAVAFSPDGRLLAGCGMASEIPTLWIWDLAKSKRGQFIMGHTKAILSVAFSPDGRLLATSSAEADGNILLWNLQKRRKLRSLTDYMLMLDGHDGGVPSIEFSTDGELLASGGTDSTVRLWDPRTGERLGKLTGHTAAVRSVAFSPNGQLLASGGTDGTVRLWDPVTGSHLHTMTSGTGAIYRVAFSPDGKLLASGGKTGTVWLRDLSSTPGYDPERKLRTPGTVGAPRSAEQPEDTRTGPGGVPHPPNRVRRASRRSEHYIPRSTLWQFFGKPVALAAGSSAVCALAATARRWLPASWRASHLGWLPSQESWPLASANFLVLKDSALIAGTLLILIFWVPAAVLIGRANKYADPEDPRVLALIGAHEVTFYGAMLAAIIFCAGIIFNLFVSNPLLKPLPLWYQAILGGATTIFYFRRISRRRPGKNTRNPVLTRKRATSRVGRDTSGAGNIEPDHGGFKHYVDALRRHEAIRARQPMTALCGWTWIPRGLGGAGKDVDNLPLCPRCKDAYALLPDEDLATARQSWRLYRRR